MRAQLITLDLAGLALKGLWKLSCAAILYFLADAVFYQGEWWNVGYAALVAGIMYYVSMAYDAAFASFAHHFSDVGSDEEKKAQQEFKCNASPKRRGTFAQPVQPASTRGDVNYARLG